MVSSEGWYEGFLLGFQEGSREHLRASQVPLFCTALYEGSDSWEISWMQIDQNGTVTVPPQDEKTFRDKRLPLRERLDKLARLLGDAAEKFDDQRVAAEDLVREAAIRLEGFEHTANARKVTMDSLIEWKKAYEREIMGLRETVRQQTYRIAELESLLRGKE